MSSERLMHVQFTSCAQEENLLRKTSNLFLLELLSEEKGNLTWYDMLIFLYYGENKYCVKSVCIWSFSGPYFPTSPYFSVSRRIQSEFGKIQTRKTRNTDTFYAVKFRNHFRILPWVKEVRKKLIQLFATLLDHCCYNQVTTKIGFYLNEVEPFFKAVLLAYIMLREELTMLNVKRSFIINSTCVYHFSLLISLIIIA